MKQPAKQSLVLSPTYRALQGFGIIAARSQCVQIQRVVYQTSVMGGLKPIELASLARAWSDLEDSRRELSGRPKLKPVESQPRKPKHKQVTHDSVCPVDAPVLLPANSPSSD